jgi:hypothetical protein
MGRSRVYCSETPNANRQHNKAAATAIPMATSAQLMPLPTGYLLTRGAVLRGTIGGPGVAPRESIGGPGVAPRESIGGPGVAPRESTVTPWGGRALLA